jgi:hypothetical protein
VDITKNKKGDTVQNRKVGEITVVEDNTKKPLSDRRDH